MGIDIRNRTVNFKDLTPTEYCIWADSLYIKIEETEVSDEDKPEDETWYRNVMATKDGSLWWIDPHEQVIPVEVEIVVLRELDKF